MTTPAPSATWQRWLSQRRMIAVATAAALFAISIAGWGAGKKDNETAAKTTEETGKTADGEVPPVKADTVHITIQTVPPRKAQVKWGRKALGPIPAPRALVLERPRDSGPLDLSIRASGFLPVHTRAYTFTDSRVAVKLTPPSEKNTLFGYREEPAPPPNPDAGAPPAVPAVPEPPKP